MNRESSWDFRDSQELLAGHEYNEEGFIIEKADCKYLELIKKDIEQAYCEFVGISGQRHCPLENAHNSISHEESNDLRLHVMQKSIETQTFTGITITPQRILFMPFAETSWQCRNDPDSQLIYLKIKMMSFPYMQIHGMVFPRLS